MLDRTVEQTCRFGAVGRQRQVAFVRFHDAGAPIRSLLPPSAPSALRRAVSKAPIDGVARGGRLATRRSGVCSSQRAGRMSSVARCTWNVPEAVATSTPSARAAMRTSTPHRVAQSTSSARSTCISPCPGGGGGGSNRILHRCNFGPSSISGAILRGCHLPSVSAPCHLPFSTTTLPRNNVRHGHASILRPSHGV